MFQIMLPFFKFVLALYILLHFDKVFTTDLESGAPFISSASSLSSFSTTTFGTTNSNSRKEERSPSKSPECPKFEEGYCQCAKSDSKTALIFENSLFRSSSIPGLLSETLNTSSGMHSTRTSLSDDSSLKDSNSTTTGPVQFNIACSFTKTEIIKGALKRVSGLNISTLTLVHNVIPVLDDNFFKDLIHLDRLYLKYNRITNISENAFSGVLQNTLKSLLIDEFYWYSFHFKAFDSVPAKALKNLKNLKEFTVSSGYLTNITKDMLNGLDRLESLTLKGYKLANLQDDAFTDLVNLRSLEIKSSNLATIPVKALSHLNALEELKIESRKIQFLNDTSFLKLGKLEKLHLSSCSINSMSDDAFEGLEKSLKYLFLDRNSLKTIPRALNALKSLEVLDLGFNDLQNISPNAFIALSNLKNLTLDMNGLITIPEESLRGLEYSLEHLSLMQNRLTQFPSKALNQMKKLKELSLTSNMIMEIPSDALTIPGDEISNLKKTKISKMSRDLGDDNQSSSVKLKMIDLSRNRINKISGNAFKGSRNTLQTLNLAINKLTEYPIQFGQFTNLTSLDLSLNNIETLEVDSLEGSQDRLEFLGINGNPWKCDCKMAAFRAWLEDWLRGLTLRDMYKMEKMIKDTKCESPDDLKGIPLHYPSISHLICKDKSGKIIDEQNSNRGINPIIKNIKNDSIPSYYFMDIKSMQKALSLDEQSNSDKPNSFKNSFYEKWYSYDKNAKLIKSLNFARNLAVMAFVMSLLMCMGLLIFTAFSCLTAHPRNGGNRLKGLFSFSPSKSNNSLNSTIIGLGGGYNDTTNQRPCDSLNLKNISPSHKKNPFSSSPSSKDVDDHTTIGGTLKFMQPGTLTKKWGRNKLSNEYDIDNEAFEDDKRAITKHEFDMPSENPYGPTTVNKPN